MVTAFVNGNLDISITIESTVSEPANVQVFDISGKLILQEMHDLTEGTQSALLKNPGIATGVYLLSIQAEHLQHVQKLIIR